MKKRSVRLCESRTEQDQGKELKVYPQNAKPATPCLYFGKHKGQAVSEIDSDYLQWVLREQGGKCPKISNKTRAAIAAELQSRGAAVPPPPPPKSNVGWRGPCSRCGERQIDYRWHQFSNGVMQIRASCSRCGALCGTAPKVEPYTTEADRHANPTAVLDAVIIAEAEGVELVSDGRSVQCVPWHKASEELKDAVRQQQHLLARMLGNTTTVGG